MIKFNANWVLKSHLFLAIIGFGYIFVAGRDVIYRLCSTCRKIPTRLHFFLRDLTRQMKVTFHCFIKKAIVPTDLFLVSIRVLLRARWKYRRRDVCICYSKVCNLARGAKGLTCQANKRERVDQKKRHYIFDSSPSFFGDFLWRWSNIKIM